MITKVPVVVVGGSANALGVLRSLTHCDLTLLCDSLDAPAWSSRYGRKILVANTRAATVVKDLVQLATECTWAHRPVLVLTEEKTVVHVSAARTQLQSLYEFLLCPEPLLSDLQSKAGFQDRASSAGSPVPRGVVLEGEGSLPRIQALQYPCVLKPLEQDPIYAQHFKKAYKVSSAADVVALYRDIEPIMPRMIVQEWLEGEDSDIYFCLGFYDNDSQLVGETFTGRKVRSWPLQVGGTASCTSAPEAAAELTRLTSDFVRATGFVGQIGMEFKKDRLRGAFYMIEPTVGRTDYQHEIATLSGCNVLTMMVAYLSRQPVPGCGSYREVIWYDEIADANALEHGARNSLFLDRTRVSAVWRVSDPLPTITDLWRRIKNRLRRLLGG
ncbi:MAG: hypothetical protein BWK72_07390 [Rhodoferax ferrireducens]|uniref:ATP-grasp domain-containing protein n=1 Tax=Rhodoferax ferrireducens TaxID=192843 RepID=A0A1W9KW03_9BURK|nr:MAG: hypothetical protein BWK72_07390 [Rhodoferax ferrireducens]